MCPPAPLSPSGIDFKADDVSILKHLRNIENGLPLPTNVISELNPCTVAPWDLPEKVFYLITRKEQEKALKVINDGYWEASGEIRIGFASSSTVGWKTTWVFYIGWRPNGDRTPWVLHEYRMEERGSYLLCRSFLRDADVDGDAVDSYLMHMLHAEESNPDLLVSINRSEVIDGRNQHGQSGVSSNSSRNVRLDLFRHGTSSQEDHREEFHNLPQDHHMELNDLQASSSSAENSFFASFNSEDSFDLDAMLHDLQSQETTSDVSSSRRQHSNSRSNASSFTINSIDGINPEVLLHELESEEASRGVSNRRHWHSGHRFNVSASIDDEFDEVASLCVLADVEARSDVPNRGQQHSNPRLNVPASINLDGSFNAEVLQREMVAARAVSNSRQQHSNQQLSVSVSINSDDGFDSDDGFNPEDLLRVLAYEEVRSDVPNRGQQHSNPRFNVPARINLDESFNPGVLPPEVGASREVSNSRQQHSIQELNASASIDSDDGINPVALLLELGSKERTSGVSCSRLQNSSSRLNIFDSISSDEGFDPEALVHELEFEETSMDVSNRGQQHPNSRFNASAPTNSDVGFIPGASLCQLQSGEMSRDVSSKGRQHVNHKFHISACQGSQQMVTKPPLSGSLRSSSGNNVVPAKEIIGSTTRPTGIIKVQGASLPISASLEPPRSVLGSGIGTIPSHVQRASQGPSTGKDGGSHGGQAGRKSSRGRMAKLRQRFCCFMSN